MENKLTAYVIYCHDEIDWSTDVESIYLSEHKDLEERYSKFLVEQAAEQNITINPHWGNIMDYNHNLHLADVQEYKLKSYDWGTYLAHWTFERFIRDYKLGTKQDFINIY